MVDDLAAEADHHARGGVRRAVRRGRGVPGRHEPDPDRRRTPPCRRCSGRRRSPRPALRARWPPPRSPPPARSCAWRCPRCRRSGRRARASGRCGSARAREASAAAFGLPVRNGSIEDARVALGQLEAGMAQEADLHVSVSFSFVSLVIQLTGELPAHGDAHQHPHPGLLGQQRAQRVTRSSGRPALGAWRSCASCASPNQPPSSSAWSRIRWSCGAIRGHPRARRRRSARGRYSARTAASSSRP